MDNVKLSEYIASEEEKLSILREKDKKRKFKFKTRTIGFCVIVVIILIGTIIASPIISQNEIEAKKSLKETDVKQIAELASDEKMMSERELFHKYERACIGNAITNILNNGLIADSIYGYSTMNNEGIVRIISSKGSFAFQENNADCINLGKDKVFYRNDKDHKYYSCDYKGLHNVPVISTECGQCALYRDRYIYYLDYDHNTSLYEYDLKNDNTRRVIEEPVKAFVKVGDTILYQNYSNELRKEAPAGFDTFTVKNVDKFYFNGDIIIQNNDEIVSLDYKSGEQTEICSGIEELLGANVDSIYYSKNGTVYQRSLSDGAEKIIPGKHDYYTGVYIANGKTIVIGGEIDEDK